MESLDFGSQPRPVECQIRWPEGQIRWPQANANDMSVLAVFQNTDNLNENAIVEAF